MDTYEDVKNELKFEFNNDIEKYRLSLESQMSDCIRLNEKYINTGIIPFPIENIKNKLKLLEEIKKA